MNKEEIKKGLISYLDSIKWGIGEYHEVFGSLINMLSLPEKDEWIPVSERLPEKTGFYLCTVGATWKNPRVMKYEPKECVNDAYLWQGDDDSYVYNWFVEAWRPLPAPYKAEKGSEEK